MACKFGEYASMFKALSDDSRVKIVQLLSEGEVSACHMLRDLSVSQPTLSYHLKTLSESGLISGRRDGCMIYYSLNKEKIACLSAFFKNFDQP